MTTGKGYAPTGKSKVIPTPYVNRNNKKVKVNGDKKVLNAKYLDSDRAKDLLVFWRFPN